MLSKENKAVLLLADFNIDLLKSGQWLLTNEFLDSLPSHMVLSHIVQPKKIINNPKTLIANMHSNLLTPSNISGNLTATRSDHFP